MGACGGTAVSKWRSGRHKDRGDCGGTNQGGVAAASRGSCIGGGRHPCGVFWCGASTVAKIDRWGSGLIVEVDVKGRRRVSWDRNKGGVKNFKWVPRACKVLGQGKLGLGLGSNKLAAQLPSSKPSLGPNTTSPKTLELGEGSFKFVAGGPVRTQKEWVQAEKGGMRFLVPPMRPVPQYRWSNDLRFFRG
ncbi:hypothetical protein SO802_032294 [Lithocarpus litseifolius]|uniref:Uncharacterized protein n=1 Tax=Lithocarpus litseifolius TaxID=425828 RepID=A0AAW2BPA5_9ROSI